MSVFFLTTSIFPQSLHNLWLPASTWSRCQPQCFSSWQTPGEVYIWLAVWRMSLLRYHSSSLVECVEARVPKSDQYLHFLYQFVKCGVSCTLLCKLECKINLWYSFIHNDNNHVNTQKYIVYSYSILRKFNVLWPCMYIQQRGLVAHHLQQLRKLSLDNFRTKICNGCRHELSKKFSSI